MNKIKIAYRSACFFGGFIIIIIGIVVIGFGAYQTQMIPMKGIAVVAVGMVAMFASLFLPKTNNEASYLDTKLSRKH